MLVTKYPHFNYRVLVRSQERRDLIQKTYPALSIVPGGLDDEEVLKQESSRADVIISTRSISTAWVELVSVQELIQQHVCRQGTFGRPFACHTRSLRELEKVTLQRNRPTGSMQVVLGSSPSTTRKQRSTGSRAIRSTMISRISGRSSHFPIMRSTARLTRRFCRQAAKAPVSCRLPSSLPPRSTVSRLSTTYPRTLGKGILVD